MRKKNSFIDVNYIEPSELDRINNVKTKPNYQLLECVIASGCPLTLQKLINKNKIGNFKKEELDLVVALLKQDAETLNKNQEITLSKEISRILLDAITESPTYYKLKDIIPFIDVNDKNSYGDTISCLAISLDDREAVELLLTHKALDINEKGKHGSTLLYYATFNKLEAVKGLLTAIDINEKDSYGNTLLYYAIMSRRLEVVKLLLSYKGINVNEKYEYDGTPLSFAINTKDLPLLKALVGFPDLAVNEKNEDGDTHLHNAISLDNLEVAAELLRHPKIAVNEKNKYGNTPLYDAIFSGKLDIAELLLKHPYIDVNGQNSRGTIPLYDAIFSGKLDIAELLLKHQEIVVNGQNSDGMTPIDKAILSNNLEAVKLLLKYLDIKDVNEKDILLSFSLAEDNPEILELLNGYKDRYEVPIDSQDQEIQSLGKEPNYYDTFGGA